MRNLISELNLQPKDINLALLEDMSARQIHQNNVFTNCKISTHITGTKKDLQIYDSLIEGAAFKNLTLVNQTIISNVTFTNVCFYQSKIEKILFYHCTFDDSCSFDGTQIDAIEVIDCIYPSTLFANIASFHQEVYIPTEVPITNTKTITQSSVRQTIHEETLNDVSLIVENALYAKTSFNNVILTSNDAIKDVDFIHCIFNDCTFIGCWSKSIFDNSVFKNCIFKDGNMKNCSFVSTTFTNPKFASFNMIKANLSFASITIPEDEKAFVFQETYFPPEETTSKEVALSEEIDPFYEKYINLLQEIRENLEVEYQEKATITTNKIMSYAKTLDPLSLLTLISQLSLTANNTYPSTTSPSKEVISPELEEYEEQESYDTPF